MSFLRKRDTSTIVQTISNLFPRADTRYLRYIDTAKYSNYQLLHNPQNVFANWTWDNTHGIKAGSFQTYDVGGGNLRITTSTIAGSGSLGINAANQLSITAGTNLFLNAGSGDYVAVGNGTAGVVTQIADNNLKILNNGHYYSLTLPTLTTDYNLAWPLGQMAIQGDTTGFSGKFIKNQSGLQAGSVFNVARGIITGQTPVSVSTASGTNAPVSFVFTAPNGGSTSNNGSFAVGGNASDLTITMGKGGSITGTPATGVPGNGGNIYFLAGDAGSGGTVPSAAGEAILQGGLSSNIDGASGGNTSIKGGNGETSHNTSGGNVYLVAGQKNGTGLDGGIFVNVSAGGTVRGNTIWGSQIDDHIHRLQVTGSAILTDTVITPKIFINGTAGQGYADFISQTARPTGATGHLKIYRDSVGSFSFMNGIYRRTFKVPRSIDQTITYPYRLNPTLADSSDIATSYIKINSTTTAQTSAAINIDGNIQNGGRELIGKTDGSFGAVNLRVSGNITGGTQAFALRMDGQIQSDVTSTARMYYSFPTTAAASFTIGTLNHYEAAMGSLGAGSSVTTQNGFMAGSSLSGATNNRGYVASIGSASTNYNFLANGMAQNAYLGSSSFGKTTAPGFVVDINGTLGVNAAVSFSNYTTAGILHNAVTTGAITSSLIQSADLANSLALPGAPTTPTPGTNVNTTQIVNGAWTNTYFATLTLVSPTVVRNAAGTLTLTSATDYVFTGSTTTWTLPAIAGLSKRTDQITIKNAGSGNITLNSNTGSTIYDTSLVGTITIAPGSAIVLIPDGTQFNRE